MPQSYPSRARRTGNPLQRRRLAQPVPGSRASGTPTRPTSKNPPRSFASVPRRKPILGPDTVQEAPAAAPTARGAIPSYAGIPTLSGGTGTYQLGADPALAKIEAVSTRMRAQAEATALAKRKQAALEYGDPTGVAGVDPETAKAARENPFSVLASQKRIYERGVEELEDDLNEANLFYSGWRGKQLGQAATDYQQQQYDAATRFRGYLTDVEQQLAAANMQADIMDAEAAMAANQGFYDPGEGDLGGYEGYGAEDYGPEGPGADPGVAAAARPSANVIVAGKAVPRALARKQLNRAISEAKVRAKALQPTQAQRAQPPGQARMARAAAAAKPKPQPKPRSRRSGV